MLTTSPVFEGVIRPHVSLDVQNVERSIAFYRALFGTEPVKTRVDYAKFELQNPPLNFSLNQRSAGAHDRIGGNLDHLGFQVASTQNVTLAKERLIAAGLMPIDEMDVTCCYATQDKIWVHDPDGTPWEIFTVTAANTENRSGAVRSGEGAVCCAPGPDVVRAEQSLVVAGGCCAPGEC